MGNLAAIVEHRALAWSTAVRGRHGNPGSTEDTEHTESLFFKFFRAFRAFRGYDSLFRVFRVFRGPFGKGAEVRALAASPAIPFLHTVPPVEPSARRRAGLIPRPDR